VPGEWQTDPETIVDNWLCELFCDVFGTLLIGPAYPVALKYYAPDTGQFDIQHPPVSLRLEFLQPITDEFVSCVQTGPLAEMITATLRDEATVRTEPHTIPFTDHIREHAADWLSHTSSLIRKMIAASGCSLWVEDQVDASAQLSELVELIRAYVPPVGHLMLDRFDDAKATLSVAVPKPGLVLLAALLVRHHKTLWHKFNEPWRTDPKYKKNYEAKAEDALEGLLVKALADGDVHGRLQIGFERERNRRSSCSGV